MRDELVEWVRSYPKDPPKRDPAFKGTPVRDLVTRTIPEAIKAAVPEAAEFKVRGGIGEGRWTNTPWVAVLDPTVTVEDGVYLVYLLSRGCDRLYLSIAQGCTALYNTLGKRMANIELRRRAGLLRPLILDQTHRLTDIEMKLQSKSWRGPLYEAGSVVAVEYAADRLPQEAALVADLREAISLYQIAAPAASWSEETAVLKRAREERGFSSFDEAKRYGYHRRIERKSNVPKKVKKALGTVCMGCKTDLAQRYGPSAKGLIEAHHLKPLSQLREGAIRKMSKADFAVLCPNCHRVIHRMKNPSDLKALRALLNATD